MGPVSDRFVIQVKSANRWSLHSYKDKEAQAVAEAKKLLKQKICDEAKVIKKAPDGTETVLFDENQNSVRGKAGLGHISEAPQCESVDDLYGEQSRHTMSVLLRDYFDQRVIMPSEILHSHRDIEKFTDDSLCASALDRIAAIQAAKAGDNESQRRDKLYDLMQDAKEKARKSGRDEIGDGKLGEYLENAGDLTDPAVRFRVMTSLSQKTMRAPAWEAKFSVLFELIGKVESKDMGEKLVSFLDDYLGEMLCFPTVIQEMLGQQPDRFNAIDVLTKLCIGKYEARKWDTPALKHMADLMSTHPMSHCRRKLAERVEQMLRSRSALTKGDMYEEKHAFKQLLPLFISKSGNILGGENMAEALTMCGVRSFNRDRNLDKPKEAVEYVLENLGAPILQLRYLLTLSGSPFGKECAPIVVDYIPSFMEGPEHVHDIVHYRQPTKRKIKVITDLQKSALKIKLPNDTQVKLVEWLDDLLFSYLDEERIIDKMDSPEDILFVRATNLLQFCASGLLIEGKTLNWVRDRVQEHLRQPNFVEKFTSAADTQNKKDQMITQLHIMLKKAGLQQ
jgi:hypothetical protein